MIFFLNKHLRRYDMNISYDYQIAPFGLTAVLTTSIPFFLTIFIVNDDWLITNRSLIEVRQCSMA